MLSGTSNAEHLVKESLRCSADVESSVFPFYNIRCFRLSAYFFSLRNSAIVEIFTDISVGFRS